MEKELDLTIDDLSVNMETPKSSSPTQPKEEETHIDWSQHVPTKSTSSTFIGIDPNNFYKQNLQFLTGQKSAVDKENIKRPIFRLAVLLDSGKDSLAKRIYVPNSTNPAEIDNVPWDYYNITNKSNLDNLSVFFIDFAFEWRVDEDRHDWVKPIWVQYEVSNPWQTQEGVKQIDQKPVATMKAFHLRPKGTPKKGIIYSKNNPFSRKFWEEIIPSFDIADPNKYSTVYTIWFQKRYFGFNVIEELFKDTSFVDQVKYFKDVCLKKKIIDLFDLSDLISKNDMISKRNDIFLLFTKWLNYKNTTINQNSDTFNKKYLETMKNESYTIDSFKRLDDLFYYLSKVFINILDQCLYENWVNQVGSKGILLEDFFSKDYALPGTAQEMNQEKLEMIDDKLKRQRAERKKAAKASANKPSSKPTSKKSTGKKSSSKPVSSSTSKKKQSTKTKKPTGKKPAVKKGGRK